VPTPLLFVGDLHLGRSPQRLLAAGLDPARLSAAEAWRRTVDLAIERGVRAVVLAGDVVDADRDRFEAYGHLERGVKRLLDAGIATLGVAGNHDGIVFPRLADRLSGFRLLGRDRRWERVELDGGDAAVDLLGWSFRDNHHPEDPLTVGDLAAAVRGRRADAALLGVLHCDLGAVTSRYAPVSRAALEAIPTDAWFLGHVHLPSDLRGPRPIGYLGSVVGLDRGESGIHGPCLVTVQGPGRLAVERVVVGPVVWWDVEVDVSSIVDASDAEDQIHAAIGRRLAALREELPVLGGRAVEVIAATARLVGASPARQRIGAFARTMQARGLLFPFGDQTAVVVKLQDDSRRAVDLRALQASTSPLGALARLILSLESGEIPDDLRARARRTASRYAPDLWDLDPQTAPALDEPAALAAAARRVLDALLAQDAAPEAR
jgi:exonuclease SbcD